MLDLAEIEAKTGPLTKAQRKALKRSRWIKHRDEAAEKIRESQRALDATESEYFDLKP